MNLSFFLFCCFSVSITLDNFLTENNLLNYNFLNDSFNHGFLNKYRTLYRINTLSHNTSRQLLQIEKKSYRPSANIDRSVLHLLDECDGLHPMCLGAGYWTYLACALSYITVFTSVFQYTDIIYAETKIGVKYSFFTLY